jgi:anti-sigma factor RsiW
MACDESLRIQAYLDGETAAACALEIERHLESCADCAQLKRDIEVLGDALRSEASYFRATPALRASLTQALDRESSRNRNRATDWLAWLGLRAREFWTGAATGAFATAAATALALVLIAAPQANQLSTDIVNAHVRSLMENHLIDVVSSDRHTVKPWFAGHVDVSPPVADFAREGYPLVGGRADYLDGRRVAVVVYRHGAHIINVFAWANGDTSLAAMATRNGYHMVFWKSGNLSFCAISDTAPDELLGLTKLLKALATPDSRE